MWPLWWFMLFAAAWPAMVPVSMLLYMYHNSRRR